MVLGKESSKNRPIIKYKGTMQSPLKSVGISTIPTRFFLAQSNFFSGKCRTSIVSVSLYKCPSLFFLIPCCFSVSPPQSGPFLEANCNHVFKIYFVSGQQRLLYSTAHLNNVLAFFSVGELQIFFQIHFSTAKAFRISWGGLKKMLSFY